MMGRSLAIAPLLLWAAACLGVAPTPVVSHPPLRSELPLPVRGVAPNALYVDAHQGDDAHAGSPDAPFRTLNHALTRIAPGQTLYLRAGTYRENVYVAAAGTAEAPILISAYPGEKAVIDGGIPDFFEHPADAWQPLADGAAGEYRSARTWRNILLPVASFGDSMVGLQTYYHAIDLRATQQRIHYSDSSKQADTDHDPLYCGPGLWYDQASGYLHARLAHTDLDGVPNYRGETDPRKLPLVIAPFRAVPLTLHGARHLTLRDLVIRGGGYDTVKLHLVEHVTFDNIVIWAGTYGFRAECAQHLRILNCGIYGNVAPWTFRSDTRKRDYPGRPQRNITRLNTHALLVIAAGLEESVFATPMNDHWEIAHSAWTDAHDGLYLGGINVRFHHNLVEDLQDDAIYLSQMYPRHLFMRDWPTAHIHQNIFRHVNMPIAFGADYIASENGSVAYIYRNVFDQRLPLNYTRPATDKADRKLWTGLMMADHDSPAWPAMYLYHNTLIAGSPLREAHMGLINAPHADRPRRVFNNIFLHTGAMPAYPKIDSALNAHADGNLFWSPKLDEKQLAGFFQRFRDTPAYAQSQTVYPPGFDAGAVLADPLLDGMQSDSYAAHDYQLKQGSPAIDAGVTLPPQWPDPLRDQDAGRPDIGAWPAGVEPLSAGPRTLP